MASASATIPVGYKQTKVGLMPEDWGIIETKEVGVVQTGPFGAQLHASDYVAWGTPLILIRNMKNGKLSDDGIPYVSDEDASRLHRYSVRAGDLIFSRVGRVGSCVIILPNQEGWLFSGQTLRIRFDTSKVNPHYAAYYFGKDESQRYILKETLGTTRASINTTILSSTPIILPAKGEQDAIAVSISNVDMLIESIENLIAKKRDIKQGTMQELLTGKTRLPGFTEEWDYVELSNLATTGSGGTPDTKNPKYYRGNIPWVSITDMTSSGKIISTTERKLTRSGYDNSATRLFPKDTILYAMYASIGECCIAGMELTTSQAILGIQTNSRLNFEYLYYYLKSIKHEVISLGQQGTQSNLNSEIVRGFKIPLPEIDEQEAIAEVLSDMDAEISALEQRLEKTKAIKQGMMQQLLTGRIRLVDPSTPVGASA